MTRSSTGNNYAAGVLTNNTVSLTSQFKQLNVRKASYENKTPGRSLDYSIVTSE